MSRGLDYLELKSYDHSRNNLIESKIMHDKSDVLRK